MLKAEKWSKFSVNLHRPNGVYDDEIRTAQKYIYGEILHLTGYTESRLHPTVNTVKIFPDGKIEYYRNKEVVNESKPCDMLLEALTAGLI